MKLETFLDFELINTIFISIESDVSINRIINFSPQLTRNCFSFKLLGKSYPAMHCIPLIFAANNPLIWRLITRGEQALLNLEIKKK